MNNDLPSRDQPAQPAKSLLARAVAFWAIIGAAALFFAQASTTLGDGPQGVASPPKRTAPQTAKGTNTAGQALFRGKVVLLKGALDRSKTKAGDQPLDKQVVLETDKGELIPIVPDWRGKAFYQDPRLRDRPVELIGKRPSKTRSLQVLMVFTFDAAGRRQYTDYYCDTCGFPAYELRACECCQGPLRLRFQPRELPDYIVQRPATRSKPSP